MIEHTCIAYCKPDEGIHAGFLYTAANHTRDNALEACFPLSLVADILSCEIEPDAPAPEKFPGPVNLLQEGPPELAKAWLVIWKEREMTDGTPN